MTLAYLTDRDGVRIVDTETGNVLATIPDDSPLFNEDSSFNTSVLLALSNLCLRLCNTPLGQTMKEAR